MALTGVGLTDNLPGGMTVASVPSGSTTCPGGTVTAVPNASSFALSGAGIAGGATCSISVNVSSFQQGNLTNTLPIGAIASTQGATNPSAASATLTVLAGTGLGKSFSPNVIAPNGVSTLTITLYNSNVFALTNVAFTDTLPAGVTIGSPTNAATTCGAGSVSATSGGGSVGLSAGTISANSVCTVTVSVTASAVGQYTNTIPIGAVSDTEGVTNPAPASDVLSVRIPPTVVKAFAPTAIGEGTSVSTLTVTLSNTNAVALTGATFTDTLPPGVTTSGTPNASTTCGGAVTANPNSGSFSLSGGTIPAAGNCNVKVDVKAAVAGTYTNTIPAGGLTTLQRRLERRAARAPS